MRVFVVYHLEAGYETSNVAVFDNEDKAKAYVAEYMKDNIGKPSYQWQLADYDGFDLK